MNTNERIKKISRKYLIIILLLCAIIVTGTLYALFSDTSSIDVNSTSGSLHLNKNGETKTRYYIAGSTEQSTPYTETVSNLKPNDIIDIGFVVTNAGNVSAYTRDRVVLTVSVNNPTDMPTDIPNMLVVYVYNSANPVAQRANIRAGNDSAYTKITLVKNNTLSTVATFVYEYKSTAHAIINGVGIGAEIETGGVSSFNTRYLLYFNNAASTAYQKVSIKYEVTVEAIQYRNNATENWV